MTKERKINNKIAAMEALTADFDRWHDIVGMDADGIPITRADVVGSNEEASLTQLKAELLSFTRTKEEQQVINLLCEGYTRTETAQKLKISRFRVDYVLRDYKKRLKNR